MWKEHGTRYHPSNIRERYAYGRGSVCVCGGVSDLHVFQSEIVNTQVYRDAILDVSVRPYAEAISDAFLLQANNARPHRARIADEYLQQKTIMRMEWPARSSDLNPIEQF